MTLVDVGVVLLGATDVPGGEDWLSERERATHSRFRFAKRGDDWRMGRWAAKTAILRTLNALDERGGSSGRRRDGVHPSLISIEAARDGAPEVFVEGRPAPFAISISHAGDRALAGVAPAGTSLGCDVELVQTRARAFVSDYLTASEQTLIAVTDSGRAPMFTTLVWSAKESALKADRTGLRSDTRWVEVSLSEPEQPPDSGWSPLTVTSVFRSAPMAGWWRLVGDAILTVVATPAPRAPTFLDP